METPNLPALTPSARRLHERLLASVPRQLAAELGAAPATIRALRDYLEEVDELLKPVDTVTAATLLLRLFVHYPQPNLKIGDQDASELLMEDWLDDLEDVPHDLLAEACRAWRRSRATWRPTPGQLLDKIAGPLEMRRAYRRRAAETLRLLTEA